MKIFNGLSRTDYEEVLRAVGAMIDDHGWTNVTLLEIEDGLVIQVMARQNQRQQAAQLESYLLTDSDLERVLREAVTRGRKRIQAPLTRAGIAPALPAEEAQAAEAAAQPVAETAVGTLNADPEPLDDWLDVPPMPSLEDLEREMEAEHQGMTNGAAPGRRGGSEFFEPAPMRLSPAPDVNQANEGTLQAAIVMAHIVAARLRSGQQMNADDPDLASLLDQVRALDEDGIGDG